VRAEGTVGRRIVAIACVTLFGACTDSVGPDTTTKLPTGLIVSQPIPIGVVFSGTGLSASLTAASSSAGDSVVYVSLPPGTAPNGELATVQNLRTGSTTLVAIGLGGFDPVALGARTGDSIAVVVRDAGGAVVHTVRAVASLRRPPVVVRTNPPPGKRDVPLNASVVVVFSEPIDLVTLTVAGVQVRRGSTPVPGTLAFLDSERVTILFTPAAPLAPSAVYTLMVTQAIHDLAGEALESAVTEEFTTAATAPSYEEYFVDSDLPLTGNQVGDSVSVRATVRVMDGAGHGIEGALVRFRGSIGRVEPETARAGLDGLTNVHWMFHGTMGGGAGSAELTACASNSATRCDMYWSVLVVGLHSP